MTVPPCNYDAFCTWMDDVTSDEIGLFRVLVELPDLLRQTLDQYEAIVVDPSLSETDRATRIEKLGARVYPAFQVRPSEGGPGTKAEDCLRVTISYVFAHGRKCSDVYSWSRDSPGALAALACICSFKGWCSLFEYYRKIKGPDGQPEYGPAVLKDCFGEKYIQQPFLEEIQKLADHPDRPLAWPPWDQNIEKVFSGLDPEPKKFVRARRKTRITLGAYFKEPPRMKDPARFRLYERQIVAALASLANWLRFPEYLRLVRGLEPLAAVEDSSATPVGVGTNLDGDEALFDDLLENAQTPVWTAASMPAPFIKMDSEGVFLALAAATPDGAPKPVSDLPFGLYPAIDAIRPFLAGGLRESDRRMALWALHRKKIWVQALAGKPKEMTVYAGGRAGLVLVPTPKEIGAFEWAVEVRNDDDGTGSSPRWTLPQMVALAKAVGETGAIVVAKDARVLAIHIHPLLVTVAERLLVRYPETFRLEQRATILRALERLGSDLRLVLRDDAVHINDGWPVVQLVLETATVEDKVTVVLRLRFRYRFPVDDRIFAPNEGRDTLATYADSGIVAIIRDRAAEAAMLAQLRESLLGPGDTDRWDSEVQDPATIAEILNSPALDDVVCEWPADGPLIRRAKRKKLVLRIKKSDSKVDLLAISGDYVDDNETLSLNALVDSVKNNRRFAKTESGVWLQISAEMRDLLSRLVDGGDGNQLTIAESDAFAALAGQHGELGLTVDRALERFLPSLQDLAFAEALKPELPSALATKLRSYQVEGFDWMTRLAAWAPGGILGDDMGLGKTLQAIAFAVSRADRGPTLVVVPKSLVSQWAAQVELHTQHRTFETHCLRTRADRDTYLKRGDSARGPNVLVITTYDHARLIAEDLAQIPWRTVIIDEAHNLRNTDGKRHDGMQDALSLRDKDCFVLAMTGTPFVNKDADVEALMSLVTGRRFRFGSGGEDTKSSGKRDAISPFFKRRRKEEVAKDLPDLVEQTVFVELSEAERTAYNALHQEAREALAAGGTEFGKALGLFTTMRQFVCDPSITQGKGWTEVGSKLALVVDTVTTLVDAGRPCLVFSSFTTVLDRIATALGNASGVGPVARIDGRMNSVERERAVEDFQAKRSNVFLISLMAGGEGLNLTQATDVILVNPWWNRAADHQAIARAHRIGQNNSVTAWRFIAKDTIEEQIVALAAEKLVLVDEIVEGAAKLPALTHDAILKVLQGQGGK